MPAKGADVSIFIDIIGMPRTPVSYARRRAAAVTGVLSCAKEDSPRKREGQNLGNIRIPKFQIFEIILCGLGVYAVKYACWL